MQLFQHLNPVEAAPTCMSSTWKSIITDTQKVEIFMNSYLHRIIGLLCPKTVTSKELVRQLHCDEWASLKLRSAQ